MRLHVTEEARVAIRAGRKTQLTRIFTKAKNTPDEVWDSAGTLGMWFPSVRDNRGVWHRQPWRGVSSLVLPAQVILIDDIPVAIERCELVQLHHYTEEDAKREGYESMAEFAKDWNVRAKRRKNRMFDSSPWVWRINFLPRRWGVVP